jgi:YbgC/YbaW family acyl-CoA thioester hydrolase
VTQHHRTVLFQEIDAAGIVFFSRIFDWFHDAYFAHLAANRIDMARVLAAETWAAPLVHAEADYRRPFRFDDRITVEIVRGKLGEKALTVEYRIIKDEDPTTDCVTGSTVHAFVDRTTMRPRPIPDEVRAAFT